MSTLRYPNGHEDDCAALKYEGNACTCSSSMPAADLIDKLRLTIQQLRQDNAQLQYALEQSEAKWRPGWRDEIDRDEFPPAAIATATGAKS